MFKGIDKKRPTRAPYEVHDIKGMKVIHWHSGGLTKDISMLSFLRRTFLNV
jgi:hypothetical protein